MKQLYAILLGLVLAGCSTVPAFVSHDIPNFRPVPGEPCFFSAGRTWWLLRDAPASAAVYAALGVVFWVIYAVERHRSRSL